MSAYTWSRIYKECVIYEDNNIIAIDKPSGISVIGDRNNEDIGSLAHKENINIIPVHRIDKETSGLLLLAKNQQTQSYITRQFNKRQVKKTYFAIVRVGDIPKEGTIDLPLSIGRKHKVRIAAKKENIIFDANINTWFVKSSNIFKDKRNYPSKTNVKRVYEDDKYMLLSLNPLTGRTHQIRVHLAWIGFPILGDPLFEKENIFKRTYLHSYSLSFINPETEVEMTLKAPPQEDFLIPLKNFSVKNFK